ncbi:MAG: TolC family outer membrane protein [Paracoccaceae bacterium]
MKLSVLAVSALIVGAGAASADTLRQALIKAYNNSGLLEQNRAVLRAADEDVAQAAATLRPVFNWSAGVTHNFSNTDSTSQSLALSAEMTIYDGGSNKFAIEATKETVLATRQSLISVEQNVLLDAVQAYMDVRRETETVALRQNNLRVIQEELRAAQDRFDVGEVTKTDVALAEARLASSLAQLEAAKGATQQAKARYKQAVGVNANGLSTPPSLPKLPASAEAAQSVAIRNHPAMRQIQHTIKAADLNIARAKTASGPTATIGGSYGIARTNSSKATEPGSISFNIRGPIYTGGNIPSVIRKAQAQKEAQVAKLHVSKRQIEQATATSYALLDMARASRKATEEQIRASQVAFDGTKEEAKLGARTTLDVLNAEQDLLNAKASLITALVEEQVAAYRLLAQMGQLTVDHLNLPVQKYDPDAYYNHVKDAPAASDQGKALDRVLKALGQK